ncbi:hypothetical protein B9Z55_002840 [Caenorhabditis nigoni]|nr:hypothetical protein B9Z55_002840 [Caenorhabditis nigoni]
MDFSQDMSQSQANYGPGASQSQSQSQFMDGSSLSGWSQSQTRPRRGYQGSTQQMSQDMDDMEQKMSDLLMSQDC